MYEKGGGYGRGIQQYQGVFVVVVHDFSVHTIPQANAVGFVIVNEDEIAVRLQCEN